MIKVKINFEICSPLISISIGLLGSRSSRKKTFLKFVLPLSVFPSIYLLGSRSSRKKKFFSKKKFEFVLPLVSVLVRARRGVPVGACQYVQLRACSIRSPASIVTSYQTKKKNCDAPSLSPPSLPPLSLPSLGPPLSPPSLALLSPRLSPFSSLPPPLSLLSL